MTAQFQFPPFVYCPRCETMFLGSRGTALVHPCAGLDRTLGEAIEHTTIAEAMASGAVSREENETLWARKLRLLDVPKGTILIGRAEALGLIEWIARVAGDFEP